MLALFAFGFLAYMVFTRRRSSSPVVMHAVPDAFAHVPPNLLYDVSALTIAIDWRARRTVQEQLASMRAHPNHPHATPDIASGRAESRAELLETLRRTANLLKEQRVAWLYAGGRDVPPAIQSVAQARFQEMVADLRTRYRHELRGEDWVGTKPKPEEGEGVVVVSIVVAARGDLFALERADRADAVERHLDRLADAGLELQAFEVIWSPAAEDDRMSTAELAVVYPELTKLDPTSAAGRVFCGHCNAPYAGELESCPACGAPRISA